MKEEGIPFKIVFDNIFDIKRVITTPSIITPIKIRAENRERNGDTIPAAKNIVIIDISMGKRPLHGTKLFVIIAISLSRGESIIRQPITPAALQPNPMHIVSACFPWAQAF